MLDNKTKLSTPLLKRIFDIILSIFVIVITLPLFILIFTMLFIEHILSKDFSAPLLYTEQRVSQGKFFNLYKFNIFKPKVIKEMRDKGEFIHTKALEHDSSKLTFTGKIVQKIYLDELPQIFCILFGDMSFVGPRPVNRENYKKLRARGMYTKDIVKSGLTGDFQSHKGEKGTNQDALDEAYIRFCQQHNSAQIFWHDLKIIFKTFIIIFRAQGY